MTRHPKTIIACLVALAATACATVGEDDPVAEDPDPGLGVAALACFQPGCQEQGRTLLSAVLDVDDYLSFPLVGYVGTIAVSLRIGPSGLRRQNGKPLPSGLTLTASNGAVVEILSITSPPGEPGPQYELSYTSGSTTVNPCLNGTAIAIDGDFNATAHHDENTVGSVPPAAHRFSFACKEEGVAYKCRAWGYPPGSDPTADGWKAHQVCTRAARADYCKNGKTHTLDETFVRIWDDYVGLGFDTVRGTFQGLGQWPPLPGIYKFESVWPEDDDEPPTCLGKDRWQALEPGELDSCEGDVHPADPRNDTSAQFCEDLGNDGIPSNSIVFESKYTDLLLEDWVNGDDQAVSVTGYFPGVGSAMVGKRPFDSATGFTHVQTLGTLLRSLPGSIDEEDVMDVYTYDDGGTDHVLAGPTGSPWTPPLNGAMTWEGMVFKDPPPAIPATVPLYACEHTLPGGGSDFYNSTDPECDGDVEHGLIGHILAPPE